MYMLPYTFKLCEKITFLFCNLRYFQLADLCNFILNNFELIKLFHYEIKF